MHIAESHMVTFAPRNFKRCAICTIEVSANDPTIYCTASQFYLNKKR
jgi:hypothetical protein